MPSRLIILEMNYIKDKMKLEENKDKVPIYRGCQNQSCFCSGKCREIIGWREKTFLEKVSSRITNFRK